MSNYDIEKKIEQTIKTPVLIDDKDYPDYLYFKKTVIEQENEASIENKEQETQTSARGYHRSPHR